MLAVSLCRAPSELLCMKKRVPTPEVREEPCGVDVYAYEPRRSVRSEDGAVDVRVLEGWRG